MDWNDLRHFLALARLGSVRAAGSSLGVSHSTVARRVEALEEQLATQLFDRHRDGFLLTEAGQQMLASAERVEREMASIERGLAGRDTRLAGPVRLTCCDTFVSSVVLGELADLCARCPDIDLHVEADSRSFDLSKREADIAVRILAVGAQPPEHLIGSKLAPLMLANYVAVEHADRLDPERVGTATRWLAHGDRKHSEQMIAGTSYPDVPAWGRFTTLGLLVQGAVHGLGITMLPCYVGDADPRLRRLAQSDLTHPADLWLLSHPDLRNTTRLREAREMVRQAFVRKQGLFRGDQPQG